MGRGAIEPAAPRSRSSKRLEKELKELRELLRIVRQRLVEAGLVRAISSKCFDVRTVKESIHVDLLPVGQLFARRPAVSAGVVLVVGRWLDALSARGQDRNWGSRKMREAGLSARFFAAVAVRAIERPICETRSSPRLTRCSDRVYGHEIANLVERTLKEFGADR